MHHKYITCGTCSRSIDFDLDAEGRVSNISFVGGCNGNLKGIASLCDGQDARTVIERLRGIRCGLKPTSCPDQLATALDQALNSAK